MRYVEGGGHVLLVDSPDNAKSTANSLLWPFGPEVDRRRQAKRALAVPESWPSVPVGAAAAVNGGGPFARLGEMPVAATVRHGGGTATAVGLGARFTDPRMGVTGDIEPWPDLRRVFDLQFTLLSAIVDGTFPPPATTQ